MKKIIACISLVFAMSAGVTALAADATYSNDDTNTVSMDATSYTTVLIEDASDNILYVDQNDSGLGSAAKFLLKGTTKLADGTYTVTLGGSSTAATTSSTFTVTSKQPVVQNMTMKNQEENEDGSYNLGYFGTVAANGCEWVAITVTKGENNTQTVYYESPFQSSGDGDVNVAVKINGVPSAYAVSVALTDTNPGE